MRALLRQLLDAALAAADPQQCLPAHLPAPPRGTTRVAAVGKAAASMAEAFVAHYPVPVTGLAIFPPGHGPQAGHPPAGFRLLESAHPVPDAASLAAGRAMLRLVRDAATDDLFVLLLSGGASALMEVPRPGVSLAELQGLNRCLLAAGAPIGAVNAVRRRLSLLKGGRLALAAAPAAIVVLAISDVPGDAVADIGSGPCSPDPAPPDRAAAVLAEYGCAASAAAAAALSAGPVLTADHPVLRRVRTRVVARAADALAGAAAAAAAAGFEPRLLGDALQVPAEALAREHARLALACRQRGERVALISGGEAGSPVHAPGGRGGRNTTYLLRLLAELRGARDVWALAADTDGLDGRGGQAGAMACPDSLARAAAAGLDAEASLAASDSAGWFGALGDLVVTGPTRTNVNDLRVILVDAG